MKRVSTLPLGELLCALYDEYRDVYGDRDLAQVAALATLNDLLVLNDPKPTRTKIRRQWPILDKAAA